VPRVTPVAGLVAMIAVVAAFLRFYALGRQGFWYDEAQTGWMLRAPLGTMLGGAVQTESAPPLYYLLAWAWVRVFGDTETGLRSLSALAGVATVPAAFAAVRLLVNRRVALLAALLLAVNPLLIWYSQEARAYALFVLTSTIALWMFARAREQPGARRVAAWALSAGLAMWTHYFAVFLVVPEALALVRAAGGVRRVHVAAFAGLAAAAAPLAVLAASQQHHVAWIGKLSLRLRAEQVARSFVDGFTPPAGRLVAVLSALIVVAALVLLALRSEIAERRGALCFAGIAAAAIAVPLLGAAIGLDYFDGRNMLAAAVPCVITVAAGLGAQRGLPIGLPLAAVLTVVSIALTVRVWTDGPARRPDWPALDAALHRLPSPRVIRLVGGSRSWSIPLTFGLRQTWWLPSRGARVREFDVVRRLPATLRCGPSVWWGAACSVPVLAGPSGPPVPGLRLVSTIHAGGFSIARYRASRPVLVVPRRGAATAHARRHKRDLLLTPEREPVIR
jgi:mannosyltransferase